MPRTSNSCSDETLYADPSVLPLIRGLHSLVDGPAYLCQLIAYGPKAIPALADLLLLGKPSGISQPRQWAVEALGALGAYRVLLEYLCESPEIQSPVVRHAEQAVQNTAARELSRYETEEAFSVLFDCLRRHPLPGIIEAIGLYRRPETAPYLLDSLEDDVCRSAAIEALRGLGDGIRGLLIESAMTRKPRPPEFETASSLHRRRCCVRLLQALDLTKAEVRQMTALLDEEDSDLVLAVTEALFHTAHFNDYQSALFHLRRVEKNVPWWLRDEYSYLRSDLEEKLRAGANASVSS